MITVNFNLDSYHIWEYFNIDHGSNWNTFRNYSGTGMLRTETTGYVTRVESLGGYVAMCRSFLGFLIAGLPAGVVVTASSLHLYQANDNYTWINGTPSIAVGFYNRNADIPNTDWHDCMGTLLTVYPRGYSHSWQVYPISPALIQNGYMQFCLRDGAFDYPNITPDWDALPYGQCYDDVGFDFMGAAPYLEVTYGTSTLTTLPASNKTKTTCTLNGRLDTLASGTAACGFEWGETTAYEHGATATTNLTSPGLFSQPITGLTVNTEYHCRALATVGADTTYGDDMPFRIISTVQGISGLRHIYNPGSRIYNLEITFGGVSTTDEIIPGEVTKAADNVVIPTTPVKPSPIPIPAPFYNTDSASLVVNTNPNTSPLTITNNTKITGTNILTDIFKQPAPLGTGAGLSLGVNTTGLGTLPASNNPLIGGVVGNKTTIKSLADLANESKKK